MEIMIPRITTEATFNEMIFFQENRIQILCLLLYISYCTDAWRQENTIVVVCCRNCSLLALPLFLKYHHKTHLFIFSMQIDSKLGARTSHPRVNLIKKKSKKNAEIEQKWHPGDHILVAATFANHHACSYIGHKNDTRVLLYSHSVLAV